MLQQSHFTLSTVEGVIILQFPTLCVCNVCVVEEAGVSGPVTEILSPGNVVPQTAAASLIQCPAKWLHTVLVTPSILCLVCVCVCLLPSSLTVCLQEAAAGAGGGPHAQGGAECNTAARSAQQLRRPGSGSGRSLLYPGNTHRTTPSTRTTTRTRTRTSQGFVQVGQTGRQTKPNLDINFLIERNTGTSFSL